jgi:peptide deformylase
MILPIVSYGHSILRKKCKDIDPHYPNLEKLVEDMWETLYPAQGCGLAAPQVNQSIRLFVVDSKRTYDHMEQEDRDDFFDGDCGIKETFINAKITAYTDDVWIEDEGCLSIPTLSEKVERSWGITIEYADRSFKQHTKTFYGTTARIIQHEYDHTDGKLFLDYVKPIKKKRLKGKLTMITKGQIETGYAMKHLK